jgi:flagella basal body P-ring formation protein FlgA
MIPSVRTPAAALAALALLFSPAPVAAQSAAQSAAPITGRQSPPAVREVTVAGPEIRLGDIFTDAGGRAGQVVATAPAPGATVTLDRATLDRLAHAYGLGGSAEGGVERVVIGRADGVPVNGRILAEPILAALAARGLDVSGVEVTLNEPGDGLRLPATASLAVERLSYRPPARAFAAVIKVTDGGHELRRIGVAGEIRRPTTVPVLTRPLHRGETIEAADLRWIDADESRLPGNAVVAADAMIGLAARRNLRADQPILANDLAKPVLVTKNGLVTLILARPGMQLTARGRALADGGKGDTVRVVNVQSNLAVEGIVTGPDTVTVDADAGPPVMVPRTGLPTPQLRLAPVTPN